MTSKEKAKELVDKFYQTTPNEAFINEPYGIATEYKAWEQAKECALIAVNEMLDNDGWSSSQYGWDVFKKYFIEVKKEIENL
jgi:hypothetical protein